MRLPTVGFVAVLTCALLVAPRTAVAQPRGKIPRVAVLSPGRPPTPASRTCPVLFRQGLHDLGYVEGQNILFEYRYAEYQLNRLPALAAELVQLTPDVIFTGSTPGVLAAQQATTTIPIVVGTGELSRLITSLARPGGNITGITWHGAGIIEKRLELLKEAVPHITRVAILVDPDNFTWGGPLPETLLGAARALGMEIHRVDVRTPDELEGAFASMAERRVDALYMSNEVRINAQLRRIVELTAMYRLPAISAMPGFAMAGGLMEYQVDIGAGCRHAATYVDKILKGAKAGELPVERLDKFSLVVNLKTATTLGLTLSPLFLARANEVIK